MASRLPLVVTVLLAACGAATPAPAAPADTSAPFPYTAEEIRDANPAGRWRVLARTDPSGTTIYERLAFVESTADTATFESTAVDEAGTAIGEPERASAAWAELRAHATFPAAATTISDETVEVRAGSFACRRYDVRRTTDDGQEELSTFWFASDPSMAGPPVLMHVEVGGARVASMELVAIGDAAP